MPEISLPLIGSFVSTLPKSCNVGAPAFRNLIANSWEDEQKFLNTT